MTPGLLLILTTFLPTDDPPPPPAPLSPADRDRITAESRSQSAEADKLFKAGSYA
jgi:hypothetical protein